MYADLALGKNRAQYGTTLRQFKQVRPVFEPSQDSIRDLASMLRDVMELEEDEAHVADDYGGVSRYLVRQRARC